jgi:hypothetical protein
MRSNNVRFLVAPRHAPEVIHKLVRQQAVFRLRTLEFVPGRRINTAGQIPKEVVSVNRDIVRTHTFDPVDLEHILSRPVRLRLPPLSSRCRLC